VTAVLFLHAEEAYPAGAVIEYERNDAALRFGFSGVVDEKEVGRGGGVVSKCVLGCAVLRGSWCCIRVLLVGAVYSWVGR